MGRRLMTGIGAVILAIGAAACDSDDAGSADAGNDAPPSSPTTAASSPLDTTAEETDEATDPGTSATGEGEPTTYALTISVSGPETARVEVGPMGDPVIEETVQLPWEVTQDFELAPGGSVTLTAVTLDATEVTCEIVVEGEAVGFETGTNTCSATFYAPVA